jgi:hypothetical protein
MPLIEYIVPRSEKRIVLMCALSDRVAFLAQQFHALNPACFGLYIYRGGDASHELLLQTVRRQYAHVIIIDVTSELSHTVYVETPSLDMPLIRALRDKPAIHMKQCGNQHIQINISKANVDLTCVWLAPLLNYGATRL